MIPYNTQLLPLRLPEYGRNIHQMIDYCVHIPDRDERNRCAYTIAGIMQNLFPELLSGEEGERKIWDHMNIMADFQLDVDFPVPVTTRDEVHPKPAPIAYGKRLYKHRQYGKLIQEMVDNVSNMEDGAERDMLISMIANHMKKLMLAHNREGSDDARILHDLAELSQGRINLDPNKYPLHEFHDVTPESSKKKKKK